MTRRTTTVDLDTRTIATIEETPKVTTNTRREKVIEAARTTAAETTISRDAVLKALLRSSATEVAGAAAVTVSCAVEVAAWVAAEE